MNDSRSLSRGKSYSVLLTKFKFQQTEPANVAITWSDVCEFTDEWVRKYMDEVSVTDKDSFLLNQFTQYLKENGMGYNSPISSDSLRAYWPLFSFENYLNALFSD